MSKTFVQRNEDLETLLRESKQFTVRPTRESSIWNGYTLMLIAG